MITKASQGDKCPCRAEAIGQVPRPRRYEVRDLSWQADPVIEESESTVAPTVENGVLIVRVRGGIGFDHAGELKRALTKARRRDTSRTVVDLSGLMFADSTLLHVLLGAQREHRAEGLPMVVAGPLSPTVRRLFEVTGTADFFTMAPSLDAAVTS